ncbi:MAG: hypothetical protein AAF558_15495 [Verrucomicrobiota bacterium]
MVEESNYSEGTKLDVVVGVIVSLGATFIIATIVLLTNNSILPISL